MCVRKLFSSSSSCCYFFVGSPRRLSAHKSDVVSETIVRHSRNQSRIYDVVYQNIIT
jgi:hypothetical protein